MPILKRGASTLVTLCIAITLAFLLARGTGDPVRLMLGPEATEDRVEAVKEQLGLNLPIIVQYRNYIIQLLSGDLGESLRFGVPNHEIIADALPASLQLATAALVIAVSVGTILGCYAAVWTGTWRDRVACTIAMLGQSTPLFWVGMVLILVFAERLQWLPAGQDGDLTHLILPAITLSLSPMAKIALLTRSGMTAALKQDYILAAKARGLPKWRIVYVHALRNATLPVITIIALQAGAMISAAVTVELVFSWPGLGHLAVSAVLARDFPLVQAIVLVAAIIFVVMNLIADLTYALVDPRVRVEAT